MKKIIQYRNEQGASTLQQGHLPGRTLRNAALYCLYVLAMGCLLYANAYADVKAKLDTADGSSEFQVRDSADVVVGRIDSDGNLLLIGSGTITNGFIMSGGNAGIGTTTPIVRLHSNSPAGTAGPLMIVSTGTKRLLEVNGSSVTLGVPLGFPDGTIQNTAASGGNEYGYAEMDAIGNQLDTEINFGDGSAVTAVTSANITWDDDIGDKWFYISVTGVYEVVLYATIFAGGTYMDLRIRVDGGDPPKNVVQSFIHSVVMPAFRAITWVGTVNSGSYIRASIDSTTLTTIRLEAGSTLMVRKLD